jgi:hypothetical protein
MKKISTLFITSLFLLGGCSSDSHVSNSREAFDGCEWEKISGLGIEFMAQTCKRGEKFANVIPSVDGMGFVINGDSGVNGYRSVTVLENKLSLTKDEVLDMETVEGCEAVRLADVSPGVERYQMRPASDFSGDLNNPMPCGKFGISSLMTYFQFHVDDLSRYLAIAPKDNGAMFDRDSFKFIKE